LKNISGEEQAKPEYYCYCVFTPYMLVQECWKFKLVLSEWLQ